MGVGLRREACSCYKPNFEVPTRALSSGHTESLVLMVAIIEHYEFI
jgi:hypothetical protein